METDNSKDGIVMGTFHKASKKQRTLVLIGALVAILLLSIVIALLTQDNGNKTKNTITQESVVLPEALVSVTANGFVPEVITVSQGQTVKWTNTDTAPHQVSTDPHPQENGLEGFSAPGATLANDSYSFTFEEKGTFTYHDHLNPEKPHGTVVVE